MTQIISHWFYTLDLNNQTFQRKFLEELAFTLLHQVLRVGVVIVYMSVCAWCVYLTSGHEQEPENALRRDRWFSHMGNSVWLHWGARMHLNKQCTVLSQAMSSINDITLTLLWNWLLQCMWRSLWIPMGSLVDAEIMLPTSKQKENISNEHFLNCKQCSYISYEYTHYRPNSGVTRGRSVLCCVSDSVVFPAALRSYLSDPLEGSLSNGSTWPWPMAVT